MKKLNQKLYDALGYITRHSKNMIVQYQYIETLKRLSDRINYLTDQIEPQAELQQWNKAIDKSTEPFCYWFEFIHYNESQSYSYLNYFFSVIKFYIILSTIYSTLLIYLIPTSSLCIKTCENNSNISIAFNLTY